MLDASNQLVTLNDMAKPTKKTAKSKENRILSPIAKAFAVRLVELREAKGVTKLELARLAGVSRKFIWELEGQKKEPTLTSAEKLASALGSSLRAMLPKD